MSKKEFPRFSEAKIQFELTQPQMKLLMASVSFLIDSIETEASIDFKNVSQLVKSIQQHAMKSYRFSLPIDCQDQPEQLNLALSKILIDGLQDSYYSKNHELVEMFIDEVNQMESQLDPEIFNLNKGERIELAYDGSVTCSNGGTND